jgi:hypothetical protein
MPDEIPYYYLFVYSKLKNKAWKNPYLETEAVLRTIRNDCRQIPDNLIYPMLSQMEQYGLIKRINKFRYRIIEKNVPVFEKGNNKGKKYWNVNIEKDSFQSAIDDINVEEKIKCEDASVYKILPSKALKKLNNLNCWFIKSA